MEFLNRIELRGVVGRAEIGAFNGVHVCNFSVVTEYSTRDRDGNPSLEPTWFNVTAWEGRDVIGDLYQIQKGLWVEVTGRVRVKRYTTQDNDERVSMDIVARKVRVIPRENEAMQPQRDY